MTALLRSMLLTPNILGTDGISCLSRQIVGALPQPSMILSLHDDDRSHLSGVPIRSAAGNRGRFLGNAARLALQCGPDTVVVCAHLHLAPAARLVACRGAPVTFVLCGVEAWVPLRATERWALDGGELVAISHYTAVRFKAANPQFAGAAVEVCHPGLPVRERKGPSVWPMSSPTALIVARMSAADRYKGHDLLIDVWPDVVARHREARLCIVGDGDDRPRLESRVAALGMSGSVTFTGRISDAALDALYEACSFFVMPSQGEGFGLVFLEAMRAGKACIGARGAAEEIIQDAVTGVIVDPRNHAQLATAVLRLFDDPHACRALGAAGEARFLSTFTDAQFQCRFGRVVKQPTFA